MNKSEEVVRLVEGKKHKVKFKGKNIIVDGEEVGTKFFHRGFSKSGLSISGGATFKIGKNKRIQFDTSIFGYSRDADKWLKSELEVKGVEGFLKDWKHKMREFTLS